MQPSLRSLRLRAEFIRTTRIILASMVGAVRGGVMIHPRQSRSGSLEFSPLAVPVWLCADVSPDDYYSLLTFTKL